MSAVPKPRARPAAANRQLVEMRSMLTGDHWRSPPCPIKNLAASGRFGSERAHDRRIWPADACARTQAQRGTEQPPGALRIRFWPPRNSRMLKVASRRHDRTPALQAFYGQAGSPIHAK
jgi:hypothetical protein